MLLAAFCLFITFSPTAQLLRHAVFDTYQRLFPLERTTSPVAIVVIDELALQRYGQWPWPRTRMAELFDRIAEHEPAAIGMDILFPERDRLSPAAIAAELTVLPEEVRRTLEKLPSNEERLAEAIGGRKVVLGIAADATFDPRFPDAPRAAPVVLGDESIRRNLRPYAGHIRSVDPIDSAAASRGLLNSGPADQVVRLVPLVATVQGQIVPSLGVEALRVAIGGGLRLHTRSLPAGLMAVEFGEVKTVAQEDGQAWLRYGPHADPVARYELERLVRDFRGVSS